MELKNRDVKAYSEALILASKNLLLNPKLLNVFITLIFKKTKYIIFVIKSIYDNVGTYKAIELINIWFEKFEAENQKI